MAAPLVKEPHVKSPATKVTRQIFLALAGVALISALAIIASTVVPSPASKGIVPLASILVIFIGIWLAWQNLGKETINWAQIGTGITLVVVALIVWLAPNNQPGELAQIAFTLLVILFTIVLIGAPLWKTIRTQISKVETKAVADRQRADIAAHLHDSVLQTLALIQSNAGDEQKVRTLARREERQLRAWLYEGKDRSEMPQNRPNNFASEVGLRQETALGQQESKDPRTQNIGELCEQVAAQIEDEWNCRIEVVTTQDRPVGEIAPVATSLLKEALTNAAKHASPPYSVYVETTPELQIFVRDHGKGFDLTQLQQVPADRHGIRDSLLQRAQNHGGQVKYKRLAQGTEVQICLPSMETSQETEETS
ncbi:hypothetical protein BK816_06745 [Boudabousia tangfeifanii]|uniref:Histidine kinase/HSP90-like ATPase domain-containing protein n=1 Tax=Boudabousia tangfeifanii TaxID=1912795 RepID=A0A1D9MKY0_9ACTO|nr:hypothetical protein BK816_06745 [Boudabousia tangfeifanii]